MGTTSDGTALAPETGRLRSYGIAAKATSVHWMLGGSVSTASLGVTTPSGGVTTPRGTVRMLSDGIERLAAGVGQNSAPCLFPVPSAPAPAFFRLARGYSSSRRVCSPARSTLSAYSRSTTSSSNTRTASRSASDREQNGGTLMSLQP